MSITADLARYAVSLRLDEMPTEVVDRMKSIIVDTVACAIGGLHSDTARACRSVALELGGPAEATIMGTADRVSVGAAILTNQAMIRFLDYNDCINVYRGPGDLVSSHPSGILPVPFALAEQMHLSGRAVLEAAIVGYEVIGRLLERMSISLEVRGFHHSAVGSYGAVAIAGRLLGLDPSQLVNAFGIAGSTHVSLNILDTDGELNVMTRNVVDGLAAERGTLAARLAKRGLTGPENVIEGKKGFADILLGGRDRLIEHTERGKFYVMDVEIKGIAADSTSFGYVTAAAAVTRENDIAHADIDKVIVKANRRTAEHCGDPIKKYPDTKENADHSAFFLTAIGILEGKVTPSSFAEQRYRDPVVKGLIDRIQIVASEEFDRIAPACEVMVQTKDGKTYSKRIERKDLKGLPETPMTNGDIRQKFLECADGLMAEARVDEIIECCMRIDKLKNVGELFDLMKIN